MAQGPEQIIQQPSFSFTYDFSGSTSSQTVPPFSTPLVQNTDNSYLLSPSASPSKGKKKAKDTDAAPEEKRLAQFKPRCPQNIMDRVERVRQQRLFMIDRLRTENELSETFSVLGSTGNVYTVVIDKVPRCNCPDALKGNHCKHILFIFLKVLQVPESSPHWYQKALLSTEVEEIFAQAPLAPNSVAHSHVREAHARAISQYTGPSSQSVKKRFPTKDDDCPICYENMHGIPENGLKFCDACGNALHDECWKQWQASSQRSGKAVTCVWCRAESSTNKRKKVAGVSSSDGYLNLAAVAGLSPVRDTSTYYHGPRRGYRNNNFWDYDDGY
ncbi:hypothetical protein AMATHDRAFT_157849 [Amanita thiersii Skay4041]|uniref:SWIM-type domain-containing protein n=1 Tax=Amanita thiersii Skay4041 TaxID=703135 RepID=A0A2A9NDD2_9AGAR|nr:hypothetical protein AMATHDRAFT_157849 [Amanita thiersii Skay4041]